MNRDWVFAGAQLQQAMPRYVAITNLVQAVQKYRERVELILRELGIPKSYERTYGHSLQSEEDELVEIGVDIYGRVQKLSPDAALAWKSMKTHAEKEGVILDVVSAFRSVNRQKEIIKKKLESGKSISDILKVSAAPGYSEHHTGYALDLTSPGCEPLSEMFENTEAFHWLVGNAGAFSYRLTYPRGNKAGISYEPWHWAYIQEKPDNKSN